MAALIIYEKLSKGRCASEKGAAAMELALLLPIFALIIGGVLDFGHAWYLQHCLNNASREGARFGIRYQATGETRTCPTAAEIEKVVKDYLKKFGFDEDEVTVTRSLAACHAGNDLTVTVTASKPWFLLGPLVGLRDTTLVAATTMKLE